MPLGINLFGKGHTAEAQQESAKEMVRDWQRKLRGEVRGVDRSIRRGPAEWLWAWFFGGFWTISMLFFHVFPVFLRFFLGFEPFP